MTKKKAKAKFPEQHEAQAGVPISGVKKGPLGERQHECLAHQEGDEHPDEGGPRPGAEEAGVPVRDVHGQAAGATRSEQADDQRQGRNTPRTTNCSMSVWMTAQAPPNVE